MLWRPNMTLVDAVNDRTYAMGRIYALHQGGSRMHQWRCDKVFVHSWRHSWTASLRSSSPILRRRRYGVDPGVSQLSRSPDCSPSFSAIWR
jgi:hypothetical protein